MITRYQDPAIAAVFDRDRQLETWAHIERHVVWERFGEHHQGRLSMYPPPTAEEVQRAEAETSHEVVAFLNEWTRNMPADLASMVHHGLTSSDITDTALALQVDSAMERVEPCLHEVTSTIKSLIDLLEETPQASRTHGQRATHRTADRPWVVMHGMWTRQVYRTTVAAQDCRLGKLSGPDGGGGLIGEDQERSILARLGLRPVEASQIVPRDSLAALARELAAQMTLVEAIATNLRLWAISEVGEFQEGVGDGYVGSSSIPHKRNPMLSERLCGFARMARSYADALQLGTVQWWDRDLAHSSVERTMVPDLFHVVVSGLRILAQTLDFGEWDQDRMARNMGGFTDTAALLNERVERGADRQGAHEELRTTH